MFLSDTACGGVMNAFFQKIMPLYFLGMLSTFYMLYSDGTFTQLHLAMVAICYFLGLLVFKNFFYIFSYTYSLSVMAINAMLLLTTVTNPVGFVLAGTGVLYGARLAFFVWQRAGTDTYSATRQRVIDTHKTLPFFVKIILWLFSSALYVFVGIACWFVVSAQQTNLVTWIGTLTLVVGFLLEAVADYQKQKFKLQNGNTFCNVGVFSRIRHPNYLGELLFHIGLYIAACSVISQPLCYLAALFGPFWVFVLMLSEAVSGDKNKKAKYGENSDYQNYVKHTASLIPGIF